MSFWTILVFPALFTAGMSLMDTTDSVLMTGAYGCRRGKAEEIYPYRLFVAARGLASYGAELLDLYRRAASYVDRILKGEKVSELPIQAPTKYELVINLKTAKALGLDVPWLLQHRADEVIE
jgi:putative tryptophan/tyrosine transport system substrate-binding protein